MVCFPMLDLSKGKSFPIKRFITTLTPGAETKLSTLKIINVPSYNSDIMYTVHNTHRNVSIIFIGDRGQSTPQVKVV